MMKYVLIVFMLGLIGCTDTNTLKIDLPNEIMIGQNTPLTITREQSGFFQENVSNENIAEYMLVCVDDPTVSVTTKDLEKVENCPSTGVNVQAGQKGSNTITRSISFDQVYYTVVVLHIDCYPKAFEITNFNKAATFKLVAVANDQENLRDSTVFMLKQ